MMSSVLNLGHDIQVLERSFTFMPTFMVQYLREVAFLNEVCDVIMTSSVPNLGHVIQILVRSFTAAPTLTVYLLLEVAFLNEGPLLFVCLHFSKNADTICKMLDLNIWNNAKFRKKCAFSTCAKSC